MSNNCRSKDKSIATGGIRTITSDKGRIIAPFGSIAAQTFAPINFS
jgi:hypothetical protein